MSDIELIDEINAMSRYIQREKDENEVKKLRDKLLDLWRQLDKLRIDKLYKNIKNE
jgi:hypothetical protein